jgi:hypothetical protein
MDDSQINVAIHLSELLCFEMARLYIALTRGKDHQNFRVSGTDTNKHLLTHFTTALNRTDFTEALYRLYGP